MSRTLGRMAPTAIVFALAVWCCWPYLDELRSSLEVEQGGDLPRITSSLLSPTVEPVPKRDPFQPPPAIRADPPGSKKPEIKKLAASSPHPQAGPRQAGASDQANAQRPGTDVVKTLVLEAIYIQGDRRVALINDRVYAQGEPLAISDLPGQGAALAPGADRGTAVCGRRSPRPCTPGSIADESCNAHERSPPAYTPGRQTAP
jgi:hypothetical protein